jgi:hypothetical protein
MENTEEIWKDIPDYEGHYKVSDFGRIKSVKFNKEIILKTKVNKHGYVRIGLRKNGKRKWFFIHVLVWISFNGEKPENLEVDHIIEGDKSNNRLKNLQLLTRRENSTKHYKSIQKKSKYIGVTWQEPKKRWRAYIQHNKKQLHLGYYINEIDAHKAYQNKLKQITNGK